MKDPDSKEECNKRANQEDPIVMYFIVNEDLNMSIGKCCAQTAHACQKMTMEYYKKMEDQCYFDKHFNDPEWVKVFTQWLDTSFRKVVLRAHQKEFDKIKQELTDIVIVKDNGLTEIAPGSETVIGLYPIFRSKCPKIIKRLQVLK
jgi:peptidyl-tRNA hydrolase